MSSKPRILSELSSILLPDGTLPSSAINTANLALTGIPTAPTANPGDISTQIATTEFVNDLVVRPIGMFGEDVTTTGGLTYGYLGGIIYYNNNVVNISSGTVLLTASSTNYVERTPEGVVTANTTSFTTGKIPLAEVVTNTAGIVSISDKRPGFYDWSANYASLTGATFTGTVSGITAAQFDNSTKFATTAYVQQSLGNRANAGGTDINSNYSVPASSMGRWGQIQANNVTVTLPNVTTVPLGSVYTIVPGSNTGTVVAFTGQNISNYSSGYLVNPNEGVSFVSNGAVGWWVMSYGVSATSPAFVGTPTAPTPAVGSNNTSIATTAYANTLKSGIVTVNVGGNANVTLSAAQYGNGVIILTGALTGNISVIFPTTGFWVVFNNTTGAFSITAKTASGTGYGVVQGAAEILFGDGTNIVLSVANSIASDVLTKLKTVDGTGSGLDADLLDGLDSTNFLTNNDSSTGNFSTNGFLIAGRGGNGVALTVNDGLGNANVTFNHIGGRAETDGTNAGRIIVNTDDTVNPANMTFQLGNKISSTTFTPLTTILSLFTDSAMIGGGLTVNGNTTVNGKIYAAEGNGVTAGFGFNESGNDTGMFSSADNIIDFYSAGQKKLTVGPSSISLAVQMNVNGNEVWHAGNDGSGSGLDADLLDGIDSSGYYQVSQPKFGGDVNTITTSGMYRLSGNSLINVPAGVLNGDILLHQNWDINAATQQIFQFNSFVNYTRHKSSGTWSAWSITWCDKNDGAGSGLDADLLDGQQGSYYEKQSDGLLKAQYADLFSDAIVSGLNTATSATLTGSLTAGVAYVLGQRVVYAGGSYAVPASTTSYLDLSNTGVLTVTTSTTTTANSMRLWSVTSDASTITAVVQIAENYVTLLGMSVGGGTSTNVFIGYQALLNNTTGINNVALGQSALQNNTVGQQNLAVGTSTLSNNTTGIQNVSIGFNSLRNNISGNYNVGVGSEALYLNTSGESNVGIGAGALYNNNGNFNLAIGVNALRSNSTGNNNLVFGYFAGASNSDGSGSVFIGHQAGRYETLSNKLYIANSNTANPLIYGDFAAGYLRFNGSIGSTSGPTLSAISLGSTTTAGNTTLTATQLKASYFTNNAPQTAAFTFTTDTAVNLLAALPAAAVGSSFTFRFFNNDQSATGFAGTLAAGAGVSISTALPNPAVAKGTWADYLFTFTNVTTGSVAVTVSYIGRGTI